MLAKGDNAEIIQKDRRAVWHHLTQHKNFEKQDPFIIEKGVGMIVTASMVKII